MITLYGVARSRASRPMWMLAEIGLEYAHVPVIQAYRLATPMADDAALNTGSAAFLAVNPLGQIPCLTDGDLTLTESLGITLYLGKKYGGDLGPRDLAEDAMMGQWTLMAVTGIEGPALEMMYVQADGQANTPVGEGVIAIAAEKLRRPLRRLQAHLEGAEWMVGGRFTAADINVAECLRYAQGHPTLLGEFPAVNAWLERAQARPAFKAMWERRMAEPA